MGQLQAQFDPAAQTLTLGPDPFLSCGSGFLCPCPFQASISSGLCSLKQILFSKQFHPTAHPESTVQATGMADVLVCIGLSHVTSPGPGGWSLPHTDHMGRVRGGTLVSQKKEGAQVSPLSLQGFRGAVALGFRNSSCRSVAAPSQHPRCPSGFLSSWVCGSQGSNT